MKYVLLIHSSHAREALKCEHRYEMYAKKNVSHAREALKCKDRHEMRANNRC